MRPFEFRARLPFRVMIRLRQAVVYRMGAAHHAHSNLGADISEFSDKLLQTLSFQLRQKISSADWRSFSPCSHFSDYGYNSLLNAL